MTTFAKELRDAWLRGRIKGAYLRRERLMNALLAVDAHAVALEKARAFYHPSDHVVVESDDPYVPNPFKDAEVFDRDFTEADGFILDAAYHDGKMRYLDGDCEIVAFTRYDFLNFIHRVIGARK